MLMTDGKELRRPHNAYYFQRTRWPMQCLWFLLPLLIVYELGTWMYVPAGLEGVPQIKAEVLLRWAFSFVGAGGMYLPPLLVVAALFGWHLVRHDPWAPELKLYVVMLLESCVWAAPLVMFSVVFWRQPAAATVASAWHELSGGALPGAGVLAGAADLPDWKTGMLVAIGAGIYEELLFRLIGIAVIHTVLRQLLGMRASAAAWGAIGLSAVAFALYHYNNEGMRSLLQLDAQSVSFLLFATLSGVYLGAIFVLRGFGIVVATHALYDIVVISAAFWNTGGHG